MNRRSFIKALFSLPVVAALPALWLKAKDLLGWKVWYEARVLNDGWVCIIHPDTEDALRKIQARDHWGMAYRAYRKAGRPALDPREIVDRYLPKVKGEIDLTDGFGSYSNVRFVRSQYVI